ncbi:uncharacterized protein LOC144113748 [Amblyomma americanum]
MDLKLVALCAILFISRGACGARVENVTTKGLPSGWFPGAAVENDTKCNYLQLAKTYTRCSLPFYADFVSDTLHSEPSTCSPVKTFETCLEDALKNTLCSNDTTLLTPTVKFFTSSILGAYKQACNAALGSKNFTPSVAKNASVGGEKSPIVHDTSSTASHDNLLISNNSLVTEINLKNASAAKELNEGDNHTETFPAVEANRKAFVDDKPSADNTSAVFTKGVTFRDLVGVTNAADKGLGSHNDSANVERRMRRSDNDPCEPKIDTGFKFPEKCPNRTLLRRMFTCGVAMHEFILHGQNPCKCFLNYRDCVEKARKELDCESGGAKDDPIIVTVKLIESLMLSWYQNPCAIYRDPANRTSVRARIVDEVEGGCNVRKASIATVVCYATYFAMTELKTPAPWTNHDDVCSAFIDVNRCLVAAQHKSNCTNIEFTDHSRKFLAIITSKQHRGCPGEAGMPNVQAVAAYVKPGCQRSKALKRALRCSISFQDLADTEREFAPPQPVPCGHVSRLHTCLEDSVEGTGCYGDINVHLEIKVYKKVLEDSYDVRCIVEGPTEKRRRAKNRQRILRPHPKTLYKQMSGSSGLRSWRVDLGLYEKNDENAGYYYDDSLEGRKPVFAGPRVIAIHPDDAEEEGDYENSDALYQKAHNEGGGGWRPLAQRLKEEQDLAAKVVEVNGTSNETTPQALLQFFKPENSEALAAQEQPKSRSAQLQKLEELAKKPHGKKAAGEDDIFGNEYVENSELAMFPNGLDMFHHFRGAALARMENVVEANKSESASDDCPVEQVKLALGLCNATLKGLLLRWPNVSDVGLPLDGSSAGVKQFCSDLNTYKGCLASVLKAYSCSEGQAFNGIYEAYRKQMRLPYCAASSATWNNAAVCTVFIGLLASVVNKYI